MIVSSSTFISACLPPLLISLLKQSGISKEEVFVVMLLSMIFYSQSKFWNVDIQFHRVVATGITQFFEVGIGEDVFGVIWEYLLENLEEEPLLFAVLLVELFCIPMMRGINVQESRIESPKVLQHVMPYRRRDMKGI